ISTMIINGLSIYMESAHWANRLALKSSWIAIFRSMLLLPVGADSSLSSGRHGLFITSEPWRFTPPSGTEHIGLRRVC
ncbi:MAG: hypothetical protein OEV80_14830, partial [candidate division Zixibacteria bacterium]|nr:hypothetical protein [candidate division Zixibacteria bacterium]